MIDTSAYKDVQLELNGQLVLVKASVFSALSYAHKIINSCALSGARRLGHDNDEVPSVDLTLDYDAQQGLLVFWHQMSKKKPLFYHLDYVKEAVKARSFPVAKQGAFNQALGKKSRSVLDATGGWGGDAFLMAIQGYKVSILERNPVMALILSEAFERFACVVRSRGWPIFVPVVHWADGVSDIASLCEEPGDEMRVKIRTRANTAMDENEQAFGFDCVYLDPMFPPKRKKSAATNKQMQLLHSLVGQDLDADKLLHSALNSGVKRVVVKRPDYAVPLFGNPTHQFSSKLVHYDVYLTA